LVVSDILMPKLDGFSLCHEIKRDVVVRDVPVVLLSWKEDLLQRVRELGGNADGYLRKEAAASTVVERLREVLRARARVEQRVQTGGQVRGRLDGLTPRLVLELACRTRRDVRVTIRDASYLYEVQVRAGAPRTAIRSASDGSFERGEPVLSMLLGVSAGRFMIEPDESPCRAELSGSLSEQLAVPVARARAAQRALSAGALTHVTRVTFDPSRVAGYLECTPEPAQSLLRELLAGASPRDLLTSGRAPARLLEVLLSDFARRGAVLAVETVSGVEDISQTRVPPAVEAQSSVVTLPHLPPGVKPASAGADEQAAPISRRKTAVIYSQPPSAELESADAGWFSFQLEASAEPPTATVAAEPPQATAAEALAVESSVATAPNAAPPPSPATARLARSQDPLFKTLASSAPPPSDRNDAPGASVPVERGHRPDQRAATLDSSGNEPSLARAAMAAVAAAAAEPLEPMPVVSVERPALAEPDPLTQALLDTPPPTPLIAQKPDSKPPLDRTQPLPAAAVAAVVAATAEAPSIEASPVPTTEPIPVAQPEPSPRQTDPRREETAPPKDVVTQPSKAAQRKAASKPPAKKPAPAPTSDGGGWLRTAVVAILACGASYFGITKLVSWLVAEPPVEPAALVAPVAPAPAPLPSAAPSAPPSLVTLTETALPAGTDLPPNSGLLDLQVPAGTAIRVDGEYLGMGPARRVPLTPGTHSLVLGDAEPQTVNIKLGQRTLAVLGSSAAPAPAGSP
jgi:hypothetical protein